MVHVSKPPVHVRARPHLLTRDATVTLYAHTTDGTIGQIGALPALWLGPTR